MSPCRRSPRGGRDRLAPTNPLLPPSSSMPEFLRHRGTRCRVHPRARLPSPDERDRDAKVSPPPAPAVVAGPGNFRDDATPPDALSVSYDFSMRPLPSPGHLGDRLKTGRRRPSGTESFLLCL